MKILFVTFGQLSVGEGAIRSVALLRAIADAGNHVDVIASKSDLSLHPHVNVLAGEDERPISPRKIRLSIRRAMGRKAYDVVHAVDDAVLYFSRLGKLKKARLVYEVTRCFSGSNGVAPAWRWKWFPNHYQRLEKKVLKRASIVFSSCDEMTSDLKKLTDESRIVQIEDIPSRPLCSAHDIERHKLYGCFNGGASYLIACRVLSSDLSQLRTILLAARKILEQVPNAAFYFKGVDENQAKPIVEKLDIQNRCRFLCPNDAAYFLSVLGVADTTLFVPNSRHKYRHADILTLLNSSSLVVAVRNGAYSSLLNEKNSIQVECTASSMAEGLLRSMQEPLLSFGIVTEAQTMVAKRYSFSSFKHKVRMAYHDLLNA